MKIRIDELVERLVARCEKVGAKFTEHFKLLEAQGSPEARDPRMGFYNSLGEFVPKKGAIKGAVEARHHLTRKAALLPAFEGIKSAFDIGVGPAHLFMLLQDGLDVSMRGIDLPENQRPYVYTALWDEFQITNKIDSHKVRFGQDIPIPQGTEAVLAFSPLFDRGWGAKEHTWYLDYCRAKSARRVYWQFNTHTNFDVVLPFYRDAGAVFPVRGAQGFCFVDL